MQPFIHVLKYRKDQPRDPKGTHTGGHFTGWKKNSKGGSVVSQDGQVFYHVAPSGVRGDIEKGGLDYARGSKRFDLNYPKANYLFTDQGAASQFQQEQEEHELDEYGNNEAQTYDVWEVRPPVGTVLQQDPFSDDPSGLGRYSVFTKYPLTSVRLATSKKYDRILKFNPYHDKANGQFTTGQQSGQGIEFVSPNISEGLDVVQSAAAINAPRHQQVLAIAREVDNLLGLKSEHVSGIGAWADGAEDTVMSRISGNPSYEQVKLSAAMKGLLADQKAVIPFKVDPKGPDSMYKIKVSSTDPIKIHDDMLKAGIENHTLVKHAEHTDVYVFDPGTKLTRTVQEAGAKHGTEISQWQGRGEFLGSWTDREEGRQAYQAEIDAHLQPDKRGRWNSLYRRWRQQHPVVKWEGLHQILTRALFRSARRV